LPTRQPSASCFDFFPTSQKNFKFFANPHWHIWFCRFPQADTRAKQKEQISLPHLRQIGSDSIEFERKIDELIYKLYDLTEGEIKIAEV